MAMTVLVFAASLALLSPSPQQRDVGQVATGKPLADLKVSIDGAVEEKGVLGEIAEEADGFSVPLEAAVQGLFHGAVSLRIGTQNVAMSVGGNDIVLMPIGLTQGGIVKVNAPGSKPHSIHFDDLPFYSSGPNGRTLRIDVETLCQLFGVNVDLEGSHLRLLTPEYWAAQVGISPDKAKGRTFANLDLLPDFGISPPANNFYLWVRPPVHSNVQVYSLNEATRKPMCGENVDHEFVIDPEPDQAHAAAAGPQSILRIETGFHGQDLDFDHPTTVTYVAILSRKDIGSTDPFRAVESGDLRGSDFCVVGVRQSYRKSQIDFGTYEWKSTDTVKSVCDLSRLAMDTDLFLRMNGLHGDDKIKPGTRLIFIKKDNATLSPQEFKNILKSNYAMVGYEQAQPGDTVEKYCAKWGVSEQDFYDANPQIAPGASIVGEIVTHIAKKAESGQPAPTAKAGIEALKATGVTVKSGKLFSKPDAGSKSTNWASGTKFSVTGSVGNFYLVESDGEVGFLAMDVAGKVHQMATVDPAKDSKFWADTGAAARAIRAGMRFIGTPYKWGGDDIAHGIDCSHFVNQCFLMAGLPGPGAPVHDAETRGVLMQTDAPTVERGGTWYEVKSSRRSWDSLQAGDRIIMQQDPYSKRDGNHHTALYIGRYGNMDHAIIQSSSHKGINIAPLEYYKKIYRYAVRDNCMGSGK